MATRGRILGTAGVVIIALAVGGVAGYALGRSAHDAAPVDVPSPTHRCAGWQTAHDELLSLGTDAYNLERDITALAPFTGSNRGKLRGHRAERLRVRSRSLGRGWLPFRSIQHSEVSPR
jgi:hypothetical protein